MDIQELIQTIQTHHPEELTDRQIREIQEQLPKSIELREAMMTALSIDPSADKRPAVPEGFEKIAAMLRAPESDDQNKHPLLHTVMLLAVIGGVAASVIMNLPKDKDTPDPPTATQPADTVTTKPVEPHVATRPATRPTEVAATKPAAPVKKPDDPTTAPATQPAKPVALEAAFPLKWIDYALPGSDDQSDWRAHIEKLFIPEGGAKAPKFSRDGKYFQINGSYRLGTVPGPAKLLRLDFRSARQFELEFANGDSKVLIVIEPSTQIRMVSIARKAGDAKPSVIDSCDDHYRWQSYRCYGVDIRCQDGRMMICRGEVPIMSVAIDKLPTSGKLKCSSTNMNLAEIRAAAPLALPKKTVDPASITKTSAAAMEWTLDPKDKKIEEVELASDKATGETTLISKIDYLHAKASFSVDIAPSIGVELTIHVAKFHPTTVVSVQSEAGGDYIRFDREGDLFVIQTGDRGRKALAIAEGQAVGKEFWIRIRTAGDFWGIWLSPDSKRWWRKLSGQSTNKIKQVRFGIELPGAKKKDQGPRNTTIGEITIRRFQAFAKLADPKLVAKILKSMPDKLLENYHRSKIMAPLAELADKNVSKRRWTMACNAVIASRAVHWNVRSGAMRDLLLDAIALGTPDDTPKILAAIDELSEIGWQTGELGRIQHEAYTELARRLLESGKPESVGDILSASYLSPIGRTKSLVVAPKLLRIRLQDLIARGQWETVRREAMRAIYHAGSTNSWEDRHILAFTKWALSEARSHMTIKADPKTSETPTAMRHSLVVNDDREMLNTLGEFMFLVKGKHYKDACKRITSRSLSDDLVSLGDEEDLLQSSHFRVREVIRSTPELREVLARDYTEIGMIRLERARRQNDLAGLKSLAVQFYGTSPGFGAMHVLADRDLSNGNFWGAAGRYRMLSEEEGYEKRSDAAAKFRLASAMLGRLAGKPADKPIALPGGTFTAAEFEKMVTSLAANRKAKPLAGSNNKPFPAPEPRGSKARLHNLGQIGGEQLPGRSRTVEPASFTFDSQRMIISFADKLIAIDGNSRKIVWFHEPDSRQRGGRKRNRRGKTLLALSARPLQIGDKTFIRHGSTGRPLTCLDTKTGKPIWSKSYDHYVLSDPILIGSWVSVITASHDSSSASLQLHRVSPETGESSLSSPLVRTRDLPPTMGRAAIVGDAVIFRAEGCLVNCSTRGTIRWAKRVPFVPAEVLPDLHADSPLENMIVRNENVIFSLPGCPYVMCVSARSGRTLWSLARGESTRVMGLHADSLIVAESDRILGVNPDTGKVKWRSKITDTMTVATTAGKDSLLTVGLAKPKTGQHGTAPHNGRFLRWISARNGDVVKEIPVHGDESLYGAIQIASDGKRVFGLSNYEQNKLPKIFMIDIEN